MQSVKAAPGQDRLKARYCERPAVIERSSSATHDMYMYVNNGTDGLHL